MHLVEAAGRKVLLDCGLVRPVHGHPRPHRGDFPFPPHELDAVVLSHAHIDHCGNLPALVRQGFTGPIYCTPATRDLLELMLTNSARFQEEDAHILNVLGHSDGEIQPLFTHQHVDQTLHQCITIPYDQPQTICSNIEARLVDAGHILGSAMVALTVVAGDNRLWRITFTGDLGRRGSALMRPPAVVPVADLLLCETTYGGRKLESPAHAAATLAEVARRTVERGGKVLIPAFSLGRTQVVVHSLLESIRAGRLPEVPIFVDGALATDIAAVYQRYRDCLANADPDFLNGPLVHYLRTPDEGKEVSTARQPCVLIAASGMCEGGRIMTHLKHNIDDPRCTVVLVNYQAPHTPGRQLLERGPTVRFHGRKWNKWADVIYLPGFSGHGDHDDLMAYLEPLVGNNPAVRLVHGEPEGAAALALALSERGFTNVAVPGRGEMAVLGALNGSSEPALTPPTH
jgi:metallo-beta-lactamase family protein